MAKARVIIKRRKAVRNIRKITKVMQMISTARYQKAFRRAVGTKPYVRKIGELVTSVIASLQAGGRAVSHPLLQERPVKANRLAVLVLTSNRGLAGGYNGNVLRLATAVLNDLESQGITPELHVSGKKGLAYFRFSHRPVAQSYIRLGDNPRYNEIEQLAEKFMDAYVSGKIDGLKVVYMRFISAGQQKAGVIDILPLGGLGKDDETRLGNRAVLYDFSPSPVELLEELIPTTVKISLFQAFIEAVVSEHIARMVAMKAATDNAEKLDKKLTQDYNRARQTQITSELSELMGGVEALK